MPPLALLMLADTTMPGPDTVTKTGDWLWNKSPYLFILAGLCMLAFFCVAYTRKAWLAQNLERKAKEQGLNLEADAVRHKQNLERLDAEAKIAAFEAEKEASKALVAERVKDTVGELNASRAASDAAVIESNKLVANVHELLNRMETGKR